MVARLQAVQRGQAAGGDIEGRARAVVGEGVPCGELQHFKFGGEIACGIDDTTHRRIVGRDEDSATFRGTGQIGHDKRLAAPRHLRESERAFGVQDLVQIGHR